MRLWAVNLLVLSLWLCLLCNIVGNCESVDCKVTGIRFVAVFIVQCSCEIVNVLTARLQVLSFLLCLLCSIVGNF